MIAVFHFALLPFALAIAAPALSGIPAGDVPTPPGALVLDDPPAPLAPKQPLNEAERDKKEAMVLFASGRAMELADRLAPALKNYQRALRLDPQSADIAREIIPLAIRMDREGEAVRYALLAAKLDPPPDPLLLRQLGAVEMQKEEWRTALKLFEHVAELRPTTTDADDVLLQLELGRLYHLDEKFENAADCFAEVIAALEHPDKYGLDEKTVKTMLEEPADLYQTFGDAFVRAGRVEEAKSAFQKADAYLPDKTVLEYELARVADESDKPAEALAHLETAFQDKLSGRGIGPYELFADILEKSGKKEELLPRLEKLFTADADNLSLGYFLASRYADAGALDKAAALYSVMLKKTPTYTGFRCLAGVYARMKNYEDLIRVLGEAQDKAGMLESLGLEATKLAQDADLMQHLLDTAEKRAADSPEKMTRGENLALAMLATDAKRWKTADSFFAKAVKADPRQAGEVYLIWGLGLLLGERADEAANVFREALDSLQLPEDKANFYFYLAGALALDNRIDEALAAANKAAELKPASLAYLARPAWVLAIGKRYEEAVKSYTELLKKREHDFSSEELRESLKELRLSLSNTFVQMGRFPDAEEQLQLVLDEYPEDAGALNDLGYLWADRGEHLDRASRMIRNAVEIEPENAAYRDSLGWILFRQEKYAEAVSELQSASEKNPDGTVLDHLGDACQKLGKSDDAKNAWRRAVESFQKQKDQEKAAAVEKKLK